MAKRVRKKDVDRISKLSDAILSHILSFLSTKQAVRTSILSTRWRYLFALVPNLDFQLDYRRFPSPKKPKSSTIKSFQSFVDRVLFFHNSIEKFCLKCGQGFDSSRVCGWISAALWLGVQHLDLTIYNLNFTTLPGVLFTCRTLLTLKLDINFILDIPNYICFPNLKTLHLKSIEYLNDDSVVRLFSSCISLEEMVMEECHLANISNFNISHHLLKRLTIIRSEFHSFTSNHWILIDAPLLVYFKYKDYEAAGYSLENLQSLVSADIDFHLLKAESITNNHHQANVTPFFGGIRNVQSLILSSTSLKLLFSCEPVPVYPNMVRLKIYRPFSTCCYDYQEKKLASFLRGSPELEKLAFYEGVFSYLPEKVPSCLLFKLKEIEISEFVAGVDCIKQAKYFLKNAGVLEKLTIRARPYLSEKEKLNITEKLRASLRKSKQCCILIV